MEAAGPRLLYSVDASQLVSDILSRLEKASRIQEQLAESRENLLVQRQNLRSIGNSVRLQRDKSGDAEAAFMKALQTWYYSREETIPPAIDDAFQKVESAHNDLGPLEDRYFQAERSLSGSEWTFMDKENDVYRFELSDIFSNLFVREPVPAMRIHPSYQPPPPPPPPPAGTSMQPMSPLMKNIEDEYYAVRAELEFLRKHFDTLRLQLARRIDIDNLPKPRSLEAKEGPLCIPELPLHYLEVLKDLMACEVKLQRLKHQLIQPEISLSHQPQQFIHTSPQLAPDIPTLKTRSETAIPVIRNDLATRLRLREWLLDCLRSNVIEKAKYFAIRESFGPIDRDDLLWVERASEYWDIDSQQPQDTRSEDCFLPHRTGKPFALQEQSPIYNEHGRDNPLPMHRYPVLGSSLDVDTNRDPSLNGWSQAQVPRAIKGHAIQSKDARDLTISTHTPLHNPSSTAILQKGSAIDQAEDPGGTFKDTLSDPIEQIPSFNHAKGQVLPV